MTQLWTFLELRIDSRVEDIGWKLHLEVRWRYQKQDRDEETDGEEEGNGRVDTHPMVLPSAASMVQTQCKLCS